MRRKSNQTSGQNEISVNKYVSTNNILLVVLLKKLYPETGETRSTFRVVIRCLDYGMDDPGFLSRSGFYPMFKTSRLILGPTQPPTQWAPGVLSQMVQQWRRQASHSSLPSAEAEEPRLHSPLRHHGVYRKNFTFTREMLAS
jgi:hypothetical protein